MIRTITTSLVLTAMLCLAFQVDAKPPAVDHDEAVLYAVQGALLDAQKEANDKKIKNIDLYSLAVESYNDALDKWRTLVQAKKLNTKVGHARKELQKALNLALSDLHKLQRSRGINP